MRRVSGHFDAETAAYWKTIESSWAAPGVNNPADTTPIANPVPNPLDPDTPDDPEASQRLAELESRAGVARTSSGVKIAIPDLMRLAAHAHHYFLLFARHTAQPLYLGRTKRLASPAQRLVAIARDRGCTRPGCMAPADHCQANHTQDWSAGGHTDADTLVLGCGPDNRLAYTSGWSTHINPTTGRAEWTPPPLLDTGQDHTNHHFHPEELLRRDDGDDS